jgi:hypothetical protein
MDEVGLGAVVAGRLPCPVRTGRSQVEVAAGG